MFEVGQQVKIVEGIYSGRTVEIVEVVGVSRNSRGYVNQYGYSVRGLTTPDATMSTFWDDQLEAA